MSQDEQKKARNGKFMARGAPLILTRVSYFFADKAKSKLQNNDRLFWTGDQDNNTRISQT
jgi:hypothetical protein